MNVQRYSTADEMAAATVEIVARIVSGKPEALLCFPAGHTALRTFQMLADAAAHGRVSFERCRFVGLDEWLGLGADAEGTCRSFLERHIFKPLGIPESRIVFFDPHADDLERECSRIDEFVRDNGGIDCALLGIGMNGHLGLNEPGSPLTAASRVVELDTITRRVGLKYFSRPVALERGITLGLGQLMEAATVILQACGTAKAPIVDRLLRAAPTQDLPASILKSHRNAFLILDTEAASGAS